MIVDASVVVDAVSDPGPRGIAARQALRDVDASERLVSPGHFAIELMSGLRAVANRPGHPLSQPSLRKAFADAESLGISIEATPWADVRRAWALAQSSLRYADALYVAAAERHRTALLTSDARIARSRAQVACRIITVE
jgi:predicted nucleic acid-binding protein